MDFDIHFEQSPLQAIAAEIQEMRRILDAEKAELAEETKKFNAFSPLEKEIKAELDEELNKIRAQFTKRLEEVNAARQEHRDNIYHLRSKLALVEGDLAEKDKLYAKLLQEQNEEKLYTEMHKELSVLCAEFEAYHKAHPYQMQDILFTIKAYREGRNGILNANDLGLGKTFESIISLFILKHDFIREHGRTPRVIWLTKSSLVNSTPREITKWWPDVKVIPIKGSAPKEMREFMIDLATGMDSIVITNYETIRTTPLAANTVWDIVVIDEVHKLKGGANSSGPTAIWKAIKNVCLKARFTLMLSGTPMVNKVTEMWSYLHIFSPERFPSARQFEDSFTKMQKIGWDMKIQVDVQKLLDNALKGQMIRRRRDEVGLQLPELTREFRVLEMNDEQAVVYNQMRDGFFVWLDEQEGKALTATAIIAQLTRLRQINIWPAGVKTTDPVTKVEKHIEVYDSSKIDECMDIITEANDQVVVFCTFNAPLHEVARRAKEMGLTAEVLSGENSGQIGALEAGFQNKKIDVLCINSAMGEGLNLQKNIEQWEGGAAIAVFLDQWWSPARNEQSEGRIHRQGAHLPVTIYVLHNDNSVDAFIQAILDEKDAAFKSIMEDDKLRPTGDWRNYLKGKI